jgi:hypothetical protein
MELRRCHAEASTSRALVALLAPIALYVYYAVTFVSKGYSLPRDNEFLVAALTTPLQIMGHVAVLLWMWRLWPPAWEVLWHGPYLVTSKDDTLFLPGNRQLALSEITAVSVHRGFWTKEAVIETRHERASFAADFMTVNSDQRLRELAKAPAT